MVRGPSVARAYYKGGSILDHEGFFDTGDVATIDPYGYMQITDRSKDVIKSGGEWISSIDLMSKGCTGTGNLRPNRALRWSNAGATTGVSAPSSTA
jgi:non-ribosomal peptide synthetase component E (peptide arylation enzyme)